tara:strand:+ start:232 stop:792 length:561 start_codon:yes stop_codon:yes gene_type:complete
MFGHDRRTCHLNIDDTDYQFRWARHNWENHCDINAQWVAEGGAGVDIPEPQPSKTPFELACENKCKITKAEECCICMEALGDKNTATTACGHQFHFGCLTQHTRTSNSCPMCRAVICPEVPKRELKMPTRNDIIRFGARSTAPLVRIMAEIGMGDDGTRTIMGEAFSTLLVESHTSILDAVRRSNR